MDSIKLEGTVKRITDLVERNNFRKRDCVIETDGDFKQIFAVEFPNEKEELLDVVEVGQKVSIQCNLRGRDWVSPQGDIKNFISLTAWKIN